MQRSKKFDLNCAFSFLITALEGSIKRTNGSIYIAVFSSPIYIATHTSPLFLALSPSPSLVLAQIACLQKGKRATGSRPILSV